MFLCRSSACETKLWQAKGIQTSLEKALYHLALPTEPGAVPHDVCTPRSQPQVHQNTCKSILSALESEEAGQKGHLFKLLECVRSSLHLASHVSAAVARARCLGQLEGLSARPVNVRERGAPAELRTVNYRKVEFSLSHPSCHCSACTIQTIHFLSYVTFRFTTAPVPI